MKAVIIGFVCAFLGSVAQILFKLSTPEINFSNIQSFFNKYLVFGFVLYGIAFLLYLYALKSVNVSILYSTISMSYVFVLIFSRAFLGEKTYYWNYIGALLIVLGISLIMKR